MKNVWKNLGMLPVLAGACLVAASALNHDTVAVPAAAAAVEKPAVLEPIPAFTPEQLRSTPMGILLDPGIGSSDIQPLQARGGTQPAGWTPETPLDLTGPMPEVADVRNAIAKAVEFVLAKQNENGSWDVELTGDVLSDTADQAVDAIAATGLAGVALHAHKKVDPKRVEAALKRGAQFTIDRVFRGKLPLNVWYANWRYTLGLKFLHLEFMSATDPEYRADIQAASMRMINGLLKLQRSNDEAPALEKKRKTRLSGRAARNAMPSQFGVVLTPPTDEDYRGGALVKRVLPGSVAERAGIKEGDRITETEGLRIENALDYYMLEAGFMSGQRITFAAKQEGGRVLRREMMLDQTWPGYLGLKLGAGTGEGPVIEGFGPFSPCAEKLEVGDIIYEIGSDPIKEIADLRAIEANVKPGEKLRIKVMRGERNRKSTSSIDAAAAPEGWFGFGIEEEDKGDDNGVIVRGDPRPGTGAATAGLKDGDRVTWIGDTPILGLDHLLEFSGTVAGGRVYSVRWIRDGAEMQADMLADPTPQPFDLGIRPDIGPNWSVILREVTKGGAGEKAGFKANDRFKSINGVATPTVREWQQQWYRMSAGETATFVMTRGNQDVEITVVLPKADPTTQEHSEEGGWLYYPQMNYAPSFSTSAAMIVLMDVQRDLKIPMLPRILRDPLKNAGDLVNSLRAVDKENGGEESYVYGAPSLGSQLGIDIRGCQGRNVLCELSLVRLGAHKRKSTDLRKMITQWVKHRHELDAVRGMILYQPPGKRGSPHNYDRYNNAAYYWLFGHYYTLLAAKEIGSKTYTEINEICVKALMQTRKADGTWFGHPSFGPLCGTCEALWILGETTGDWRDGYGSPTTQDKTSPETGR
jgi:S1-C subfamily serine protease